MAYASVASLSQTIDLLLSYHQDSISPPFKDQIIALHKLIIFLQSFLEDSPRRANNWEETIQEVTDKAEDTIELLLMDSLLKSIFGSSKANFEKTSFHDLERVREEIESIVSRVKGGSRAKAQGCSNHELVEIISRLFEGPSMLEIIPIVGMGGIGKTTLARHVYNHPIIVEHFDVRAWSTVSTNCNLSRVISDVLNCTRKAYPGSISTSEDKLIESLYKNLHGKRYLIVLDDVWSEESFYRLKFMFPDSRNRSRIILTTRSFDLAYSIGYVHKVGLLDEDKTWDMLQEKIFEGDPCPLQLKSIGKDIAISCRGHPLSIEVVSGILSADQTVAAWGDISDNMKAFEDSDRLLQILSLGYTYLPRHLKPCFLYLGIFPQNQRIRAKKLIKLWVAEGFVKERGYKSLEETGEEHLEDLVRRNLVSVSKRKSNGRVKSITIHDLMLDLSLRHAHIDNFIHVSRFQRHNQQTEARKLQACRRVCNLSYGDDSLKGVYGSTIRSMFFGDDNQLGIKCSVGNARLLRILDFSNAYYLNLPEEVFELFHLRYLAFDCWFSISEAISNLQNLQTLIICSKANGRMFNKLPEGIWRLPQLRHLLMFHLELPGQNGARSALEDLQTLSSVKDFVCSRENLKMIPNLKKLNIYYTESFKDVVQDIELHNLKYLHKLEILKIEVEGSFVELQMNCAFPPTLKQLNLCGLKLPWEAMKIVASLPDLEVLKLRAHACIGNTWETSEGGFSQLTFLLIEESNLEHWITETTHFPKLKCLVLRCCLELVGVPNGIGEIPSLESVELDEQSNRSLLSSAKRIQEDRQSLGYDHLQVRVV